jgi:hypothetical protein
MLDNNGYTMFHPQLDAFVRSSIKLFIKPLFQDAITGEVKPIFNNLDFSEIEITIPLTPKPKPGFINCDDAAQQQLTSLFSTENLVRTLLPF